MYSSVSFPDTSWSLLENARQAAPGQRTVAMDALLGVYMGPIRELFADNPAVSPDEIDDITHDFIVEKFLAGKVLGNATEGSGSLHRYIRKSVTNFVRTKMRKKQLPIMPSDQSRKLLRSLGCTDSGIETLEMDWATAVVDDAIFTTREEMSTRCRPDLLAVFDARLMNIDNPESMASLAKQLKISEKGVTNLGITAKRALKRHLRDAIGAKVLKTIDLDTDVCEWIDHVKSKRLSFAGLDNA